MAEISTAPAIRSPRDQAVVDGEAVTFAWEPVPEATSYRLQIARDRGFADLLFNSKVGSRTNTNVTGVLPSDGSTLFWRVQARTDGEWTAFSQPTSFRSVSEAKAMESMGLSDEPAVGRSTAVGTTESWELWAFVAAMVISVILLIVVGYYNIM